MNPNRCAPTSKALACMQPCAARPTSATATATDCQEPSDFMLEVACERAQAVLLDQVFFRLNSEQFAQYDSTNAKRRNMPDPIPVMVLGRLAVDRRAQGPKLGASLLQDAGCRALSVSQNAGVRALLVHALNLQAKTFYEHYGFQTSPTNPMTLMLRLKVG